MKENLKKELKKMKAITLIALVITIVVLIILAGVIISITLGNDGIIDRAKTAKQEYANAEGYEQEQITKTTNEIDKYINGTGRDVSEQRIRQIIQEELANKSFPTYPTGTPQQLDASNGALSSAKTITAPGDGWIVLKSNSKGTNNFYKLFVGNLYVMGGSASYQDYYMSLPCKAGVTITYQWWGTGCDTGVLLFIPQE